MGIGRMGQVFLHESGAAAVSHLELSGDCAWGGCHQLLPLAAELVWHRATHDRHSELGQLRQQNATRWFLNWAKNCQRLLICWQGSTVSLRMPPFCSRPIPAGLSAFSSTPSKFSYDALVLDYYKALRQLGTNVDIVFPQQDFSRYKLIVAPALLIVDQPLSAQTGCFREEWGNPGTDLSLWIQRPEQLGHTDHFARLAEANDRSSDS